jgi:hypothetical protein
MLCQAESGACNPEMQSQLLSYLSQPEVEEMLAVD